MKSWFNSLFSPLVIGLLVVGCSSSAQVVPDPSEPQAPKADAAVESDNSASPESRTVALNKVSQYGVIQLTIKTVAVKYDQIAIAMTVKNQSDQIVRFYPNLSRLDIGDRQLEANQFLTDDAISGAFDPGEQRTGNLVFSTRQEDTLDLRDIASADLSLGEVIDMESLDPESVNLTLPLKPSAS